MSFISRLFSKQPKDAHQFSDEDRQASATRRKMLAMQREQMDMMQEQLTNLRNIQRQRMMQEQIEALQSSMYEDDDEDEDSSDSDEDMFMKLLQTVAQKSNTEVKTPFPSGMELPQKVSLSDEQLLEMLNSVDPKYLKLAKKMSDSSLKGFIKAQMPNIDDDTMLRAIRLVKV